MPEERNWWEEHDAKYLAMLPKWTYTWNVYGADPAVLKTYLKRKQQGEHEDNFKERQDLAGFVPLLSAIVDGYVGRASEAEKKIDRLFSRDDGPGLGSERDAATLAGRVWSNADGRGTNYLPLLNQVATCLVAKSMAWGFVDGIQRDAQDREIGGPYVRLIHPESVPITVEDEKGRLMSAVVKHVRNIRASVFEPNQPKERYTVYVLDGTLEFEIVEKEEAGETKREAVRVDGGEGVDPIPYGEGGFAFYDSPDRSGEDRILPIFRVNLTMDRYPAHVLAHQNTAYFNTYSELQNKHRTCNIIRLTMPYENESQRQEVEAAMKAGSTVLWHPSESGHAPGFAEPGAQSLAETREWLSAMKQDILFTALRQYEDSVRGMKTATESAQDSANAEHSFLNVLVAALDEFEMQTWKRIEQINEPNNSSKWGQFYVHRKRDFRPLDEEGEAMQLKSMFFSGPIPIGPSGKASVAKRIVDLQGIEVDPEEIERDVRRAHDREEQAADLLSGTLGV